MQEFMRKFIQLNGVAAKIILDHCLFDRQVFYCDELQTIDDCDEIGLIIKNRKIFMYKSNVKVAEVHDGTYTMSDGRLKIEIIVNKM